MCLGLHTCEVGVRMLTSQVVHMDTRHQEQSTDSGSQISSPAEESGQGSQENCGEGTVGQLAAQQDDGQFIELPISYLWDSHTAG